MVYWNVLPLFKDRCHRFLSHVKKSIEKRIEEDCFLVYLNPVNPRNIYIVGTPDHANVGDNAIVYAEKSFLEACGIDKKNIKEITSNEYMRYESRIAATLGKSKRLIIMHGGGNMGNQWLIEELLRRRIMEHLPKNPMIIFPQSFFYTDDEEGITELNKSVPIYNLRNNLTIVARDKVSYSLMKKTYPSARVVLAPDIVLSLDFKKFKIKKHEKSGVLLVLRQDGERFFDKNVSKQIVFILNERHLKYKYSDMISDLEIDKYSRSKVIAKKMREFSQANLIITDRLHGMIFALMSQTPCIVLSNNNHKIKASYDWIKDVPYIKFADHIDDIEEYITELQNTDDCYYDSTLLNHEFDDLRTIVKQFII